MQYTVSRCHLMMEGAVFKFCHTLSGTRALYTLQNVIYKQESVCCFSSRFPQQGVFCASSRSALNINNSQRSVHQYIKSSTTLPLAAKKERVVILGTGWGGFRVAKDLDKDKFDVTVISPRNHFLFTPLLPSTSVGTLEFRCVQEPVRTISGIHYHQAEAKAISFKTQEIFCNDVYGHYQPGKPVTDKKMISFNVPYDKLVIAVGTKSNTFGVPGLVSQEEERLGSSGTNKDNVFFLKQLHHSRAIRNRYEKIQ